MSALIDRVKSSILLAMKASLPGRQAQLKMVAVPRRIIDAPIPNDAKKAAVLILLYPRAETIYTVFMKRAVHNGDRHSGQISLPGGKKEDSDKNLGETALRETEEEIGIPSSEIELLGQLTKMYIPVSGFEVTPFIGIINKEPNFRLDTIEAQYLIEVPVKKLLDPNSILVKSIHTRSDFFLKDVPYFAFQNHEIWGATAMMTNEFLELIRADQQAFL